MKSRNLVLVVTAGALAIGTAEPSVSHDPVVATLIGILPAFKRGLVVEADERNPFGALAEVKPETVATGAEAAKITTILETLPLSGLSRDEGGHVRCVLLGDLRLEAGVVVPQLIEGQTDELVVESLSEAEVVIAWQLEAGRAVTQKRVLRRKIDFEPKVEVILPGQVGPVNSSQKGPKRSMMMSRAKSASVPPSLVPASGLPPAKP